MKKIALLSFVASSILMAGGYKIPESSTNAVALGAANIAHNHNSADAAYYNPAKMVFMSDEHHIDANLMYIGLDGTKYDGTVSSTGPYNLKAQKENFIVPNLHYVSPKLGNARVGMSIVSPAGLSKRWGDAPAKTSAEEFTLKTIEFNPSVAFNITDNLAFAVGLRVLYSDGIVKSNGITNIPSLGGLGTVSRDMTGDSIDIGYNLALAYQPIENLELGLTYRSKITMTVEGDATLSTSFAGGSVYSGAASLDVPLPASLNLAAAYTFPSKTTIEVVYEKTFWSAYKSLDFNYDGTEGPVLGAIFSKPLTKNWTDTNTFRFGLTQELDTLTLMAGLVIDKSPVPDATIGFELPDSDSTAVSLGARYKINDKVDIALAGLYSMRKDRTVTNSSLNGTFSNSNVLIISAGLGYKF